MSDEPVVLVSANGFGITQADIPGHSTDIPGHGRKMETASNNDLYPLPVTDPAGDKAYAAARNFQITDWFSRGFGFWVWLWARRRSC